MGLSPSFVKRERVYVTFQGLHEWYDHEFQKLGWMVLAHAHENREKLRGYKLSLQNLKEHIERRIQMTNDDDACMDLEIMRDNVVLLLQHVHKDFGI